MAHTDDTNKYSEQNDSEAAQVKELLDGIMGRSDAPGKRGEAPNAAPPRAARADYDDIERRAAELAAKLGGSGFSFSAKATQVARKKDGQRPDHGRERAGRMTLLALDEFNEASTSMAVRTALPVAAVIHEEDRYMDRSEQLPKQGAELVRWEKDGYEEAAQADRDALVSIVTVETQVAGAAEHGVCSAVAGHEIPAEAQEPAPDGHASSEQVEPDMEAALRDVSQFISQQLAVQALEPVEDTVAQPSEYSAGVVASAAEVDDGDDEDDEEDEGTSLTALASAALKAEAEMEIQTELREIERQIRALSAVMGEPGGDNGDDRIASVAQSWARAAEDASPYEDEEDERGDDERVLPAVPAYAARPALARAAAGRERSATAGDDFALSMRVDALEHQIVALISRVTETERRTKDAILRIGGEGARPDAEQIISSSEAFTFLRTDMTRLSEEREGFESRTVDSLDALHDALRELSERLGRMEQMGRSTANYVDELTKSAGGIASSVLVSRLDAGGTRHNALAHDATVARGIERPAEDHLPVWLDDGEEGDGSEELTVDAQADVFATQKGGRDSRSDRAAAGVPADIEAQGKPTKSSARMPGDDDDDGDVPYLSMPSQPDAAATGRTRNAGITASARSTLAGDANRVKTETISGPGQSQGNLLDAAGRRAHAMARQHAASTNQAGNGRPEGEPSRANMLFIATTLVLFVTSAALLYGMTRKDATGSAISKVNAIENERLIQPSEATKVSGSPTPASPAAKGSSLAGGDKRSAVEANGPNVLAGEPNLGGNGSMNEPVVAMIDKDGLLRSKPASSAAPSVEITSSIAPAGKGNTSGTLFDDYAGYSKQDGAKANSGGAGDAASVTLPAEIGALTLRNAAMKGEATAQHEIAARYEKGEGVAADHAKAVSWYQRAAQAGYAPAMYRMATFYERGAGVAKDYDKALGLYLSAAEKGNLNAMHNLGVLYSEGQTGRADYREAVKWYAKAAEYGVKDSQVNMAIIYQNGLGIEQNVKEAYKWYFLAAKAGDAEAAQIVQDLRAQMPAKERMAIERTLRGWKARQPEATANVGQPYSRSYGEVQVTGPGRQ